MIGSVGSRNSLVRALDELIATSVGSNPIFGVRMPQNLLAQSNRSDIQSTFVVLETTYLVSRKER